MKVSHSGFPGIRFPLAPRLAHAVLAISLMALIPIAMIAVTPALGQESESEISREEAFWERAIESNDPKLFQTYLDIYPDGKYSELAREFLKLLAGNDAASGNNPETGPTGEPGGNGQIGSGASKEHWYFAGFAGVDFWGGDIHSTGVPAETPLACAQTCLREPGCKLFTYNARQQQCFLKSGFDIVVRTDNAISGLVFPAPHTGMMPAAPSLVSNFIQYDGRSYTGFRMPFWQPNRSMSLDACLRHCHRDSECQYATYNSSDSPADRCKIWYFRVSDLVRSSRSTSFRKHHENILPTTEIVDLGPVAN